jgi:hypothetical protein
MSHTPTPWHVGGMGSAIAVHHKGQPFRVWAADGGGVADVCTRRQLGADDAPEEKANAAFIVRACNAHDELVAALHHIATGDVRPGHVEYISKARMAEIARAALAKVKS